MKKNTIVYELLFISISILLFISLNGCGNNLTDANSAAYIKIKQTDPDFIFLENLEKVLNNSIGKNYRDSVNKSFNDSISQLPLPDRRCNRIDEGGYPIRFTEADSCVMKYFREMKDAPITWNENRIRKITYYESFGGQDFFKWLKDDLDLDNPSTELFIWAQLGMYTPEYVREHELDPCDVGRIAIFLYPTLGNGRPLEVSGVKANVYNLGGLYP
jgi:hypothetical protein